MVYEPVADRWRLFALSVNTGLGVGFDAKQVGGRVGVSVSW